MIPKKYVMILKVVLVLGVASGVFADGHYAYSEQMIKKFHDPHAQSGHYGELSHIGSHKPEHHEGYAWAYPAYEFSYKVEDHHTHDYKGQHETRDGDVVKGVYWLIQPDGKKRTVTYHVDKHSGFHAHVEYSKPDNHVPHEKKQEHHQELEHHVKHQNHPKEHREEEHTEIDHYKNYYNKPYGYYLTIAHSKPHKHHEHHENKHEEVHKGHHEVVHKGHREDVHKGHHEDVHKGHHENLHKGHHEEVHKEHLKQIHKDHHEEGHKEQHEKYHIPHSDYRVHIKHPQYYGRHDEHSNDEGKHYIQDIKLVEENHHHADHERIHKEHGHKYPDEHHKEAYYGKLRNYHVHDHDKLHHERHEEEHHNKYDHGHHVHYIDHKLLDDLREKAYQAFKNHEHNKNKEHHEEQHNHDNLQNKHHLPVHHERHKYIHHILPLAIRKHYGYRHA